MVKDRKLLSIEMGNFSPDEYKGLPQIGVVVVLDNIRSAHNVGSAFRTCDSFKIDKLWLCGICAVPPSAEIHKSALGRKTVCLGSIRTARWMWLAICVQWGMRSSVWSRPSILSVWRNSRRNSPRERNML